MFKRQKEIDLKVDEVFAELYEVEGEITDYLEFYKADRNKLMKVTTPPKNAQSWGRILFELWGEKSVKRF